MLAQETLRSTHNFGLVLTGVAASLSPPLWSGAVQCPATSYHAQQLRYRTDNLATAIQPVGAAIRRSDPIDHYVPRTELGRRLLAVRRAYIEGGGRLLSQEEIVDAIRRLRAD
jgi:hypothetical protein